MTGLQTWVNALAGVGTLVLAIAAFIQIRLIRKQALLEIDRQIVERLTSPMIPWLDQVQHNEELLFEPLVRASNPAYLWEEFRRTSAHLLHRVPESISRHLTALERLIPQLNLRMNGLNSALGEAIEASLPEGEHFASKDPNQTQVQLRTDSRPIINTSGFKILQLHLFDKKPEEWIADAKEQFGTDLRVHIYQEGRSVGSDEEAVRFVDAAKQHLANDQLVEKAKTLTDSIRTEAAALKSAAELFNRGTYS